MLTAFCSPEYRERSVTHQPTRSDPPKNNPNPYREPCPTHHDRGRLRRGHERVRRARATGWKREKKKYFVRFDGFYSIQVALLPLDSSFHGSYRKFHFNGSESMCKRVLEIASGRLADYLAPTHSPFERRMQAYQRIPVKVVTRTLATSSQQSRHNQTQNYLCFVKVHNVTTLGRKNGHRSPPAYELCIGVMLLESGLTESGSSVFGC